MDSFAARVVEGRTMNSGALERLLTTRGCANVLGVSTGFIRGEIVDGRLVAAISLRRPNGRTHYRISVADFRTYCEKWCPSAVERIVA